MVGYLVGYVPVITKENLRSRMKDMRALAYYGLNSHQKQWLAVGCMKG
jgi:hypothetical protein